jgi:hypothetical protein
LHASIILLSLGATVLGVTKPGPRAVTHASQKTVTGVAATSSANSKVEELVSTAWNALGSAIRQQSDPNAFRHGLRAYYSFVRANGTPSNPYFYFVDYGLDNRTARGYVFDMQQLKLVEGPFLVAHGRGSSSTKNSVPTRFSNAPGSAATSLGLYRAQETYNFSGKSGGRHYTSIGLRLDGLSGSFNSTARRRGVVVHGAPYITSAGAGRSEGCPAMEQSRARRLIPLLANGALVFLYSPRDQRWVQQDPWANAALGD